MNHTPSQPFLLGLPPELVLPLSFRRPGLTIGYRGLLVAFWRVARACVLWPLDGSREACQFVFHVVLGQALCSGVDWHRFLAGTGTLTPVSLVPG